METQVKKILFITLSNIGDCILTLPALDILFAKYPQAEIDVLVSPRPKEIFQNNPRIKNVIVYDKHSSVKEKIKLFWQLNARRFDMIIDLRNTAFGRMLSAKYRICPPFGFGRAKQHMKDKHLAGILSFLGDEAKGLGMVNKQGLYIAESDREYINKVLKEHNIDEEQALVVVSPGARSRIKRWNEKGFVEICDRLTEDFGLKVVLVGDKEDALICQRVRAATLNPVLDLSTKTSIAGLAVLLERAVFLFSNDSAVMHLASYLDKPVLAVFGPTNELKYAPWSKKSLVVKKDIYCRPCEKAQCRYETLKCMSAIKPEDVLRAVKEILTPNSQLLAHNYNFQRILIVRTDRIGDVLLSTPAIKALRDAYPHAFMSMIVSPYAKEIVEGNPYLDEVLIYDKDKKHKNWMASKAFAAELKKKQFDLAVILHPTNRMHLVTFFAGIPKRVGYDRKMGFLLTDKVKHTKHLGQKHEAEYALDLARHLGIEPKNKDLYMPLKKDSEIWADSLLKENGITQNNRLIVINPTASCPSKIWPAQSFAELANRLILEYQAKIALISSAKDATLAQSVMRNINSLVIDLAGKTSISQLASLLKRAQLFISNDSGPVHIASAVGTPVISIFGRNQKGLGPQRWGPVGKRDIFLHKPAGCIECLAHNCVKEFACLKAINVDDVLKAVDSILKS